MTVAGDHQSSVPLEEEDLMQEGQRRRDRRQAVARALVRHLEAASDVRTAIMEAARETASTPDSVSAVFWELVRLRLIDERGALQRPSTAVPA